MIVPKIDIHVHSAPRKSIPRFWSDGEDYTTPDELRRMYNELGIEKGVQLPPITTDCGYHYVSNDDSYEMVKNHPETYDWFCNIDPRWAKNSPDTDLSYFIRYYQERGAKGVGEITCNLYFDDPRVMNLFYHCEKCEMPVLFHLGDMGNDYGLVDELGLKRLEKALKAFPNLQFIGHSQKFWAEISGDCTEKVRSGYPEGPVTPGGRVIALLRKYPNLTCDLSAGSGGNAVMRDPEFGYAFMEEFQDRLYFGTDICGPKHYFPLSRYLDECVESGKITQEAYEKISRKNALKLLNRKIGK